MTDCPARSALWLCSYLAVAGPVAADCAPRDLMALTLPQGGDPIALALDLAYPGAAAAPDSLTTPEGLRLPRAPARGLTGAAALEGATIGDMFAQVLPLGDPAPLPDDPWFDPGRARNDAFFRGLYGDSAAAVRAQLVTVRYAGPEVAARFEVTGRQCAAAQLQAAFDLAATLTPAPDAWFRDPGGSFNWRVIAGTDRLSAHSFGTAIDLNAELGGYWRWSGAAEGAAPRYAGEPPPGLIAVMERYGWIWGGKWRHYDGMHFEYRPELVIHARLVAQ